MTGNEAEPDDRAELVGELENTLLGGQRRYTRGEVAELSGLDPERTRRLWVAMGFPAAGDQDRIFTDGDVTAARLLGKLVEFGALDSEAELAMARTLGQSLSRLAEWQTRDITARIGELAANEQEALELAVGLLPLIEELMSYVWRRHVASAAGRVVGSAEGQDRQDKTVGFADMVGYTSTTRRLRATELSALLERFEEDASEIIATRRGQIVKQVGDEIMFTADDPGDAAEIALALCAEDRPERGLPELRVGLAAGDVLLRYGDVFGSVVNLAARLTTTAHPSSVLVDATLAERLSGDPRFALRQLRPVSVRGYRHLRPWVLRVNRG
ncbi:adenylate/guanylate cyclase domain-containing protein [Sciscionella sediminilitoris]|uniref:adenylate/guanylate cyclase domain-containing protein n=1 Tax=Sciscionella sediminilitoris TaxID=1445613 RepID=UPI00056CE1DB|nr:adenylate/guanylate cyclase domain-containing protein [Sciscionella sp. SE31]